MADISKLNFGNGSGSNDIKDAKAFRTDDAAETAIADGDYFPFYDTSASAKKKSLWSNIVATLKNTFAIKSHQSTATTYGVGTSSYYGHNKIIDDLTKASLVNGESLSAHMGYQLCQMMGGLRVESGPTYSMSYGIDDPFIYEGKVYRATVFTSTSMTITPGTNCEEEDQGILGIISNSRIADVTLLNNLPKSPETSNTVLKNGDVCSIAFGINTTSNIARVPTNGSVQVATIPDGYRPRNNTFVWTYVKLSTGWKFLQVLLHYNGAVHVRDMAGVASNGYIYLLQFSTTYTSWA